MGWLTTPQRFLEPSRIRAVFLAAGGLAFFVTEFGRFVYRPYVRQHGIRDFAIADSIGNVGGIVVQIFLGLAVLNATRKQSYRLAVFFSVGYVAYEFVQTILSRRVFDWRDANGSVIGLCVSLLILLIMWRLFPEAECSSACPDHPSRER